ncbi:DUF2267 domain-containing protein [Natronosalvus hydrolyticus]|uniref:DUF2267 domain-containing protein n=1 Tax=Natronosalvus hydrolyticus TaxID=2979988 RepID=UPI003CCC78E4
MTRTLLETLGERLSRGEAEDLSRYLEGDAEAWVVDRESPDAASFSADEFVARVARQTECSEGAVRDAASVVGDVFVDVVPSRELDRTFAQLSAGYDDLFEIEE